MSVQDNQRIDDQFLAGWNARDVDMTLSVLADDAVWIDVSSPEPLKTRAAMKDYVQGWFTAFPDLSAKARNRVVTEDQVATEVDFWGTNSGPLGMAPGAPPMPATGKTVKGKGNYFLRIKNGKVAEIHTYPDSAGLMMQLGMVPGM
jgi:steroid delta-isomerase-like uncharacterized protein